MRINPIIAALAMTLSTPVVAHETTVTDATPSVEDIAGQATQSIEDVLANLKILDLTILDELATESLIEKSKAMGRRLDEELLQDPAYRAAQLNMLRALRTVNLNLLISAGHLLRRIDKELAEANGYTYITPAEIEARFGP